jgi:tetratricopeptide (TPR) repeat protein
MSALLPACWVVLSLAGIHAQDGGTPGASLQTFELTPAGQLPSVLMAVQRSESPETSFLVVFATHSETGCHVIAGIVDVPVQMDDTRFEIKRALRTRQQRQADGSCLEGLALVYRPDDFAYVATMGSVVVHLPTGAAPMTDAALQHVKSVAPRVDPPAPVDPSLYSDGINRLNGLIRAGDVREALRTAEAVMPAYRSAPPAEALFFYGTLGMARRLNGNLDAAVVAYDVALRIAKASADTGPYVGVIYDNLSTVRRLQHRWEDAIVASDQALAIFSQTVGSRDVSYGIALNNRALIHGEQGNRDVALDYSERALVILREVLGKDDPSLAQFLEDNRLIREGRLGK